MEYNSRYFTAPSSAHTASFLGLLDADWKQQDRETGGGGEDGGCGLPHLLTGTLLSVAASGPSPSTSSLPSSPGWRGRNLREGEVAVVDAAVARARGASFIPPPNHPLLPSMAAQAPEQEAADYEGLCRQQPPISSCSPSPGPLPSSGSPASSMEPLPTQGQSLRHYTASRPRPRRTHLQPPSSRPQVRTLLTHTHTHPLHSLFLLKYADMHMHVVCHNGGHLYLCVVFNVCVFWQWCSLGCSQCSLAPPPQFSAGNSFAN